VPSLSSAPCDCTWPPVLNFQRSEPELKKALRRGARAGGGGGGVVFVGVGAAPAHGVHVLVEAAKQNAAVVGHDGG
jgi:hypothetical protein